jgi:hypothetical protein
MRRLLNQFLPFVFVGIALVALAFGIMLLVHLLFLGAIVGAVLYTISYVREKFFMAKSPAPTQKKSTGRIIDSDDWRKM